MTSAPIYNLSIVITRLTVINNSWLAVEYVKQYIKDNIIVIYKNPTDLKSKFYRDKLRPTIYQVLRERCQELTG